MPCIWRVCLTGEPRHHPAEGQGCGCFPAAVSKALSLALVFGQFPRFRILAFEPVDWRGSLLSQHGGCGGCTRPGASSPFQTRFKTLFVGQIVPFGHLKANESGPAAGFFHGYTCSTPRNGAFRPVRALLQAARPAACCLPAPDPESEAAVPSAARLPFAYRDPDVSRRVHDLLVH